MFEWMEKLRGIDNALAFLCAGAGIHLGALLLLLIVPLLRKEARDRAIKVLILISIIGAILTIPAPLMIHFR